MPTLLTQQEIDDLATAGKAYPVGGPWEPWCTEEDVVCPAVPDGVITAYNRTDAIQWASEILYELTGRIFPGRAKDYVQVYLPRVYGCVITDCYCTKKSTLSLKSRWNIVDVYSVTDSQGNAIDSALWEFTAPDLLVRTDGMYWPCCGVTALAAVGNVPSSLAVRAAAELACALERVDADENGCFPKGIKSITVASGSIDLGSIRDALVEGKYVRMPFVAQLLNMFPRDKARYVDVWSLDLDDVPN